MLLETLIESQQRTQQATLTAIATISDAAAKQADVLNSYLKLFQQPGEPQPWRHPEADEVDEARNMDEMVKLGFPQQGTEAEQAEWVLKNIDRL